MFGSDKKSSKKSNSKKRKKTEKKKSISKDSLKKKKTTTKKASKKAAPKKTKTTTKKAAPKKAKTKTSVKKAAPKKAKTSTKKATPKKTATKKAAPKKTTAKTKTDTRKAAPKKATAKKTAPKKSASQNVSDIVKDTTKKASKAVQDTTKKIMNSLKEIITFKPPFAAYNGVKPYLFCSYAHSDMNEVFKIIDKINQMGYRIWYDEGISPGIEWPEAIGNAVIKCDQYLVFMTPNAISSRNVRNEINLAYSKNKDLLVVFLEPTKLSSGMQLQLGTVHCIKKHELTGPQFYETLNKVLNSKIKN